MAELLVRNLDDATVGMLKRRAKKHRRSLGSEARTILEQAVSGGGDWRARVEEIQAMFEGREFSDSSDLVHEDRDR